MCVRDDSGLTGPRAERPYSAARHAGSNGGMTPHSDSQIVARVTLQLQSRVPDVSSARVEEVVSAVLADYRDSKVRDFLPVLVERDALRVLRRTSGHDAA